MITRPWLSFKIYLPDVTAAMGCDGVVASEESFTVVMEDTPENASRLDSYLSSLNSISEMEKLTRTSRLTQAIAWKKSLILTHPYHALDLVARKLLFNLPLTVEEESSILIEHSQSQEV